MTCGGRGPFGGAAPAAAFTGTGRGMTPEAISDLRRQKYNATVVRMRKVHSDLLAMRVRPDFPRPPHKPGQYCVLGLGFWEPRFPGCQEEAPPADEAKLARRS